MDLDIKRVLAARPPEPEKVELNSLITKWGQNIDPTAVLPEHPCPRMRRDSWTSLNGWWEYAIVESSSAQTMWDIACAPKVWDGSILVPFSPEAQLSGVKRQLLPTQLLWYRKQLRFDSLEKGYRRILHFQAVDYACACYVNGTQVGTHVGGYLSFCFDVTDALVKGVNQIMLCVADPSEEGTQLRGKQRLRRGNMWYTAQSGIWQTVWMETVPTKHLTSLDLLPNADAGSIEACVTVSEPGEMLSVDVIDDSERVVASKEVVVDCSDVHIALTVDGPHLWELDDPYLYGVRVAYGKDSVKSYTAFRMVGVEKDSQGVPRFCLNHRPLFVRGVLDQGYWPDGLMTAPSDEALVFDIATAKSSGFNMMRKHIKLECERWYWHCDRMGMLVWQDMVSGGDLPGEWTSANIPTLVRRSWTSFSDVRPGSWKRYGAGDRVYRNEWIDTARAMVFALRSHPCVATWVVFNESWGQFLSRQMTEMLHALDDTRPYIATSGWYDQGAGDFFAVHNYFRSMRVYRDPHKRAFMINEFGGLICAVAHHTSVDTTYGYDMYESLPDLQKAFNNLLASMDALEQEGLAGFVYTQLCDVEEEANGILTYDRRVNKLEA